MHAKLTVALVGGHSDQIINALKAEDTFDVKHHDTIPYDQNPAALVLADDRHTLTESGIDQLLRHKTVIALFKPSRTLLQTVHKATNTPVDIPSLKVADDLPLLIYSVNGMVHVAPTNIPNEAQVEALAQSALEKHHDKKVHPPKSVKVTVGQAVDSAEYSVLAISRAVAMARSTARFISNLDPPSDVIGFKKGTLDNSTSINVTYLAWSNDGEFMAATGDPALVQKFQLNWYTDFYSYATGADCRGKTANEFDKAGGVVHTIAIDRGSLSRSPSSPDRYLGPPGHKRGVASYWFVDWSQTGTHCGSSMSMTGYQPRGVESQDGSTYKYAIDFQQDMQMFNNGGNAFYTFKSQYSNAFSLEKFQPHASQRSSGVDYSVDYKGYYDHWDDPDFSTDAWWNPGVFDEANRIVRDLPRDNIPINALTSFKSSVGEHELFSEHTFGCAAFKSRGWYTSTDDADGTTHKQRTHFVPYNRTVMRRLDLTWPL